MSSVGLRDRVELVVFVDLLEGRHQQGRLDLPGDFLAEPLFDKLPRCAAGTESRNLRFLLQGTDRLLN